jgi:CPA2 family monovalent cation:H+ antiporter-2/glutathione-regulated potassium-efflux system protein KefB
VHTARTHFPHLTIIARTFEWPDTHALYAAGVSHVYREDLDTAVRSGVDVMRLLGIHGYTAQRAAQAFLRHEENSLRDLTGRSDDRAGYISMARERIEALEQQMQADRESTDLERDAGWDPETIREEVRKMAVPTA